MIVHRLSRPISSPGLTLTAIGIAACSIRDRSAGGPNVTRAAPIPTVYATLLHGCAVPAAPGLFPCRPGAAFSFRSAST